MISSKEGFLILRNWKTFKSSLWFLRSGLGGPDVQVVDVSERKRCLVIRSAGGETWTLGLRGVKFSEIPPEEIPFVHGPKQFVRFLELRLSDGQAYLFAEYSVTGTGELVM
jgi:hypothetical protein